MGNRDLQHSTTQFPLLWWCQTYSLWTKRAYSWGVLLFRSADQLRWLFNQPNLVFFFVPLATFLGLGSLAILVLSCSIYFLIVVWVMKFWWQQLQTKALVKSVEDCKMCLFQRFSVHFLRHQLSVNGLSHDGFIHRTVNVFVDKLRGYLVVFWIDRCLKKPPSRRSHTDRKVHQRHGNPEWLSQANELPNVPIEPNAEASE